ncbi:hypothetical protein AA101099_0981 [Neoasaia chiangmaiensis NBRC 101099]|uniref:Uncharacterized protein n=1 Tax=Neoasaia chiangmaiensis TaxID=320497 RepID=A0A1U9KMR5_9PROT|nr:hypothetical protein [Neoasaia chiangmaiensis]AQS87077.1 hypothetical protein A0U93_03000 [Neoasaia chiangmaiensis]GBR37990.1 hypothetical protein AA101099_0981 [Neoasaia chiangmaiensis NBRC 101099]GEN15220.1 hypothetical protein NCH01_16510 [Neoasaia chiangmaiensis]
MAGSILWSLVLALHILCIAYWVGGGAFLTLTLRNSITLLEPAARLNVQLQTYSRYCRGLRHIVPVTLLTGWALVFHVGGFAMVPWPINAMQLLGLVMTAVYLSVELGPLRAARRAIRPQPALFNTIRNRIVIMLALGALTILCAAMGTI